MEMLNEWTPFLVSIGSVLAAWRFGIVYEARERWVFLDTLMAIAFIAALASLIVMDVEQGIIITPGDLLARGIVHVFNAAGIAGIPALLALITEGYQRRPQQQTRAADTGTTRRRESRSRKRAQNEGAFGLDPEQFKEQARRKRNNPP